jgi:predicted DNA-binding transcriptional regulator AlpA
MRRISSIILEAAPKVTITSLPNGRVKVEMEEVETGDVFTSEPTMVYDTSGVARRLGVGKRSIENYKRQKRSPLPYTISMGRARFLESDVTKWLEEGKSPAAKRVKQRLR